MGENPSVNAARGSGGLCCRSSSCAVACDAYSGLSEPFGVDAQRWVAREMKAGGSWSREVQMDNLGQKCDEAHHFEKSAFLLVRVVFCSLYVQVKGV